jgi:hypothetical protein
MKNVLKINAGIACSDRANEVEPRPNEEINAGIACSDKANEVEPRPNEENTDRAITSALSKSRRNDTLLTVCFSLRGIACLDRANEVEPRPNRANIKIKTNYILKLLIH